MKFLKDLLGMTYRENKIEEVYQHSVRANANTHSRLYEIKDLLEQILQNQKHEKN